MHEECPILVSLETAYACREPTAFQSTTEPVFRPTPTLILYRMYDKPCVLFCFSMHVLPLRFQ